MADCHCEEENEATGSPKESKDKSEAEPPSLKSIARELKRAAAERTGYQDSEDEEDFSAKAAKVNGISREPSADPPGKGSKSDAELAKSQEDFRRELFQILKVYFKAAFTIIVKKRRLCPSNGFQIVRVLGVKVPKFLHPSSLEYVEEVTQKLILFLNRNTTEGCAIHIMVEKSKTLHVVQRFVFKTMGSIDALRSVQNEAVDGCCLEDLKTHCRASLIQIINSDTIKPVALPQFSRWSISIGLKKEFVSMDMEKFNELWDADPSGSHFPWKERPKSLASSKVSIKIDFSKEGGPGTPKYGDGSLKNTSTYANDCDDDSGLKSVESLDENPQPNGEILRKVTTPVQLPNSVRGESTDTDRVPQTDSDDLAARGIVCFPVSSFPVCDGLMLVLYGLQYPTPMKNLGGSGSGIVNSNNSSVSPFAIRNHRTGHNSAAYRLSQIRSRGFKPPC